jgi:hypothetical protein
MTFAPVAKAEALAASPLAFEPGSAFRYSCGTAVLGRVVSVASGMPSHGPSCHYDAPLCMFYNIQNHYEEIYRAVQA